MGGAPSSEMYDDSTGRRVRFADEDPHDTGRGPGRSPSPRRGDRSPDYNGRSPNRNSRATYHDEDTFDSYNDEHSDHAREESKISLGYFIRQKALVEKVKPDGEKVGMMKKVRTTDGKEHVEFMNKEDYDKWRLYKITNAARSKFKPKKIMVQSYKEEPQPKQYVDNQVTRRMRQPVEKPDMSMDIWDGTSQGNYSPAQAASDSTLSMSIPIHLSNDTTPVRGSPLQFSNRSNPHNLSPRSVKLTPRGAQSNPVTRREIMGNGTDYSRMSPEMVQLAQELKIYDGRAPRASGGYDKPWRPHANRYNRSPGPVKKKNSPRPAVQYSTPRKISPDPVVTSTKVVDTRKHPRYPSPSNRDANIPSPKHERAHTPETSVAVGGNFFLTEDEEEAQPQIVPQTRLPSPPRVRTEQRPPPYEAIAEEPQVRPMQTHIRVPSPEPPRQATPTPPEIIVQRTPTPPEITVKRTPTPPEITVKGTPTPPPPTPEHVTYRGLNTPPLIRIRTPPNAVQPQPQSQRIRTPSPPPRWEPEDRTTPPPPPLPSVQIEHPAPVSPRPDTPPRRFTVYDPNAPPKPPPQSHSRYRQNHWMPANKTIPEEIAPVTKTTIRRPKKKSTAIVAPTAGLRVSDQAPPKPNEKRFQRQLPQGAANRWTPVGPKSLV